ncbi:hypothetical protein ABN763_00845 [Spongiivirga sp. MCCC 1A20706]|uniref:hypothetical protein n=1 Tax=Spongiivirga sp. MCCC 1A20706 TaxID=3160963 RepID=UPI003977332B
MLLAIMIMLLLLLVIGLLFIPVIIYIDTERNEYYMKLKGLARASIQQHKKELICVKLEVPFYHFCFYPLKKKQIQQERKAKKKKGSWTAKMKKIIRFIKSFKVTKLSIDLDTGDCIINAKLYPIFALFNYNKGSAHINFQGKNKFLLELKNRPIYMVRSLINI